MQVNNSQNKQPVGDVLRSRNWRRGVVVFIGIMWLTLQGVCTVLYFAMVATWIICFSWLTLQGVCTVLYFAMVATWIICFSSMCKRDKVSVMCWMTCVALMMYSLGLAAGKRYVLNRLNPITQNISNL